MNVNSIMQKGISAGVNKFASRKGKPGQVGEGDAAPRDDGRGSGYNDPDMNKRTRQSLRIGRRMGKF